MRVRRLYVTKTGGQGWGVWLVLALNLLTLVGLLLAYLSYHASPALMLLPVFFGISFPVWVILNFLFVIFWIFRKKWWFLLSMIAIVAGWSHIQATYQSGDREIQQSDELKLMTYNVRFFDVYNWRKDSSAVTHNKIYRFLEEQQSGILCFQEFYNEDTPEFAVMDSLLSVQPATNYHIDYFQNKQNRYHWGLATFSKYPVVNRQRYQFRNSFGNYCIYTDILYQGDTLRIFNVHLESWHFEEEDYRFIQDVPEKIPDEKQVKSGMKKIYWKLRSSYFKRAIQVEELQQLIKKSPYPVIACGDFNSTPVSYVHNLMTEELTDAFIGNGKHFGSTFDGLLPFARIDYVFHDESFNVQSFKTFKQDYSDHYPITVNLNYNRNH